MTKPHVWPSSLFYINCCGSLRKTGNLERSIRQNLMVIIDKEILLEFWTLLLHKIPLPFTWCFLRRNPCSKYKARQVRTVHAWKEKENQTSFYCSDSPLTEMEWLYWIDLADWFSDTDINWGLVSAFDTTDPRCIDSSSAVPCIACCELNSDQKETYWSSERWVCSCLRDRNKHIMVHLVINWMCYICYRFHR